MSEYPKLSLFMTAYLYPYFDEEYGDEWGALARFVANDPSKAAALRSEIARLLGQPDAESVAAHVILQEMVACFDATLIGYTWRDWLTRVSDEAGRLAAHPGAA